MSLILPKRGTLTASEMKFFATAVAMASYARMIFLGSKGMRQEPMEPGEEAELKRLMQWYSNLGVDNRDRIDEWISIYSKETEDVTHKSGRKVLDKVSKWHMNQ